MRVILAAGGTGGPVVPLIAVAEKIAKKNPKAEFMLLGTNTEVEKRLAQKYGMHFRSVPAAKFRRYLSIKNIFTPFLLIYSILKSMYIIKVFKADVVLGAGGFVSVPVGIAAKILKKKLIIHQQDVLSSLSNRILAPFADKITVTFESSLKDFSTGTGLFSGKRTSVEKVIWTGNPFREEMLYVTKLDAERLKTKFGLNFDLPVLMVVGGATGAVGLNGILEQALPELVKYVQILHITGKGKKINFAHEHYHPFEFVDEIAEMYYISDVVLARAGLSTLTELSALKKVSIIVPMPYSHQEDNAAILAASDSAICILQEDLHPEKLVSLIRNVIVDYELQQSLKENISKIMPVDAAEKIAEISISLCKEKK